MMTLALSAGEFPTKVVSDQNYPPSGVTSAFDLGSSFIAIPRKLCCFLLMEFEWHNAKNDENLRKHGLDFDLARRVFDDPYLIEYDDDYPYEDRVNAIGVIDGYMVRVTYTMRGDVCRIISARGAERHEQRRYHEG